MIESSVKIWRSNLNNFRKGLILLLVCTILLAGALVVNQTNTEWGFVLTVLAIIETAGSIAAHIYMKTETELWQKYISKLMYLSSLLNPLNKITDLPDFIDKKNQLCSELILLPRIGSLTTDVFNLASSIHEWNPISLLEPSREYYYAKIVLLLNEIRKQNKIEVSLQITDLMHRWSMFLAKGVGDDTVLLSDLQMCEIIPLEIRNTIKINGINSKTSLLRTANLLNIGISLIEYDPSLFSNTCNEAIEMMVELSYLWNLIQSDTLARIILDELECDEINDTQREQYLQELVRKDNKDFSSIGVKGLNAAITLDSQNQECIIISALSSSNPDVISRILLSLEETDKVFQKPIINNLFNWNPNQVSDAVQFLIRSMYPQLIDVLFEIYENHKEISSRREAIRLIGEYGNPLNAHHLERCIKKEPIPELRNLLKNALDKCNDVNRIIFFVG